MARDPRPAAYRDIADASKILVVLKTTSVGKGLKTAVCSLTAHATHAQANPSMQRVMEQII